MTANYKPATPAVGVDQHRKAPQTINFPAIGDKTLDQSPVTLTATSLSGTTPTGLTVTFTALPGSCTVAGTTRRRR